MNRISKILKYIGISILVIITLLVLLVVIDFKKGDSYSGGKNLTTDEWCDYGYNPDSKDCCQDDDYSCEMRDRGATAQCNDDIFSFSLNHSGTCSRHTGVNIWFK